MIVNEFNAFINQYRCTDNTNITHTILAKNGGKFNFNNVYQEFLRYYIQLVNDGYENLHFVERPPTNGITFLFLDIDYDHEDNKRLYNIEHIKQIIKITNDFIASNFDINNKELETYVTEKPMPTQKNNIYKDGFHIYYPYLPLEEKHRYYIINYLIDNMKKNIFLQNIDYKNNVEKIFDTSIIKSNGILMLGSRKEGYKPYTLTHIFNHNIEDMSIEYDNAELIYTLSNQQYDEESKTICNFDDSNIDKTQKDKPKIKYETKYETKNELKSKIKSKIESVEYKRDIDLAKKLCKILSTKRADEYVGWRSVGFTLKAIDNSLFEDFVLFSKQSKKYNDGKVSCEDIWKIDNNYYTMGTLRHWARIDNADTYYKIICNHNEDLFGKSETGQHVDIANVIYELYKDRFVCIDITRDKWYEFQNHRWVLIQAAYTLKNLISDNVRRMLMKYCSEKMCETVNAKSTESFEQDITHKKYAKLMRVIEKLGDVNFRDNVVKACANKFYDAKFQTKIDSNVNLVGCENGILDLNEHCFRDGVPSDYVSKSVGYDWVEYTIDHPIIIEINKFFSEVHTELEMKEYVLTFISKILRGVPDTKLHIWIGSGSNGKSTVVDLLKFMLGDYFGVLPVTILTKKRGSSSSASPELADKFGKRLLVIQEPEHNDVIFVGQMKELGGDQIMARPLYGDPFEYVPQFALILTCNNLPTIPSNDNGTWRRLRSTPHDSVFADTKIDKPKHFLKDEELKDKLPLWAQGLLWMVFTIYYPIYKKGYGGKAYKIMEPDKVKEHTKQYKLNSDIYADFIDANLTKTNDDETESLNDIYMIFKEWYTSNYNDKPEPKKVLINYFKQNEYKIVNNNLIGVQIKNE